MIFDTDADARNSGPFAILQMGAALLFGLNWHG
jgi:hypothetical protein